MNALVLAGGARDEVSAQDPRGRANKAFVPIGGRTLVERTLAALRGVPAIGRIIVVAPRVCARRSRARARRRAALRR